MSRARCHTHSRLGANGALAPGWRDNWVKTTAWCSSGAMGLRAAVEECGS